MQLTPLSVDIFVFITVGACVYTTSKSVFVLLSLLDDKGCRLCKLCIWEGCIGVNTLMKVLGSKYFHE